MAVRSSNPHELETLLLQKMSLKFDFSERGIKRAFASYDRDRNGLLSLREMIDAVQLYLNGVPRKDVKRLMKLYDVNGDGYISFEEFYDMLSSRSATRPKSSATRSANRRSNHAVINRDNIINNQDTEDMEGERTKYLQERRCNREVAEAISIMSQAKVLEHMVADMEIEINAREKEKERDKKYSASCEEALRKRKEAGKPLFPIYAAMDFREPDLLPSQRNPGKNRILNGKAGYQFNKSAYDNDLGGTGSAGPSAASGTSTRPKSAGFIGGMGRPRRPGTTIPKKNIMF